MDTAAIPAPVSDPARPPARAAHPRICIVSHAAWGAITGGASGHAGGVEHQTSTMARWLAAHGYDITLLVWDEGQDADVGVNGVRVLKLCRREAGVPGLRFLHPRWTSLTRAMRRADADVYYQNCGEYVTGQVALWCRRHRRRFVFSVASDPECDPKLPALRTVRERVLYRAGLRRADRIIVQTQRQHRMLEDGFELDSIVLPMPCADPVAPAPNPPAPGAPGRWVWVGRVSREKRPEALLQLARMLPQVQFELIGPIGDEWSRRIEGEAATVPNVRMRGRVARAEMPGVYRDAAGLICTSEYEGFPNTFLEAWSYGVPVLSTVDPDGLIAGRGLGVVATSVEDMAEAVRRLIANPAEWAGASARAREYYLANHTIDGAIRRFADVFDEVWRAARA